MRKIELLQNIETELKSIDYRGQGICNNPFIIRKRLSIYFTFFSLCYILFFIIEKKGHFILSFYNYLFIQFLTIYISIFIKILYNIKN